MRRIVIAAMFTIVAGGAAVLSQMHSLPPDHVDTYAGEVILRAGVSGGMNYVGVYLVPQRRWFVYQAEDPAAVQETRTTGLVEYWHKGFRLTLPAEKRTIVFRRADSPVSPALPRPRFEVTSYANGYGIVNVELPHPGERSDRGAITTQDYCSPEFPSCGPFDQDPIGGGGGSAPSCSPTACSITCASGTCEASCGSGYKAICKCNENTLTATCYCTRC